jgi:hypothetical protein
VSFSSGPHLACMFKTEHRGAYRKIGAYVNI